MLLKPFIIIKYFTRYYLYKLPKHYKQGFGYVFLTSKNDSHSWTESEKFIKDTDSIPGYTITQGFSEFEDTRLTIAYNDEPPNEKTDGLKGHTKGLIVADDSSGFWLIHSVPLYPTIGKQKTDYTYPDTGTHYGQSFLCISMNSREVDKVGLQLIYNEPHFYHKHMPNKLEDQYPGLLAAINKKTVKSPPYWNLIDLKSMEGTHFKSFAKNRKFRKELYEDWVAPVLGTDLFVETWRHGPGNLHSNCTRSKRVWNIKQLKIDEGSIDFQATADHSKWAVAANNSNWICVGDINRAQHQLSRGGGTVCSPLESVSQVYRNIIEDFEPCSRN